ncbi:hypothetical protein RYX36_023633 [Vicia faba]
MPLNIDLNSPYVDHEMIECNITPSINLNDPSSSNDNEVEHGFPNHDEDIGVDALYSNEVYVMEEESEFNPNEDDREEIEFNQYEDEFSKQYCN